ncbi:MAG: alkaline phosphatase family protein [Pseudohaliea sp.]
MPSRVLLIGLDSMDAGLVQQWAADGTLPTFAALMAEGCFADCDNPPGFIASVSLWPTFYTAASPAEHGRYAFRQLAKGSYSTRVTSPSELPVAPFWHHLSEAGRRVALLDVPSAVATGPLNGKQLAYWGPHDVEGECHSWPPQWRGEFLARYGKEPVGECDFGGNGPRSLPAFRDDLLARLETRLEFSLDVLEEEPWDLFCTVFSEPHCVGHQAWHLHDASHPRYDAELAALAGDPVRDVYRAIDRAMGQLIGSAGDDARVLIYSSQGMGPAYSGEHLIDRILAARDGGRGLSASGSLYHRLFALRQYIPAALHSPFGAVKNRLRNRLQSTDWAGRPCFALPPSNSSTSCIRLNIRGREPDGVLAPGAEQEAYTASLCADLEALVDPQSGRPLVRRAYPREACYPGDKCPQFPDVLVEWDGRAPITAASGPGIATVQGNSPSRRSGDHRPSGFALLCGAHGCGLQGSISSQALVPTICQWLGVADAYPAHAAVAEWL